MKEMTGNEIYCLQTFDIKQRRADVRKSFQSIETYEVLMNLILLTAHEARGSLTMCTIACKGFVV